MEAVNSIWCHTLDEFFFETNSEQEYSMNNGEIIFKKMDFKIRNNCVIDLKRQWLNQKKKQE